MKNVTLFVCAAVLMTSCAGALDKAQAATDAKTYACRYIDLLDPSNPNVAKGQQLCQTAADVQLVLAAVAGQESCMEAYPAPPSP
jgi:hypothetical protein